MAFEGGQEDFDAVVLATHSDTALALRGSDVTALEDTVLRAIPYNANTIYLHTGTLTRCCSQRSAAAASQTMHVSGNSSKNCSHREHAARGSLRSHSCFPQCVYGLNTLTDL